MAVKQPEKGEEEEVGPTIPPYETLRADANFFEAVKNPRRIETRFRSPQLDLWQLSEAEWLLALKQPERNKREPANVVQLRFPEMEEWGQTHLTKLLRLDVLLNVQKEATFLPSFANCARLRA